MKHISLALATALIFFISSLSFAQTTTAPRAPGTQPDYPGTLVIDMGLNFLLDAPDNMDTKIFASRGFNLYYMYEYYLGESRFAFLPGIGFGFLKYEFKDNVTLSDISGNDTLRMIELDDEVYQDVKKSQLAVNYVDIPLELRFTTNKDIKGKGFMIAVGGKFGFKIDSYTRLKYKQEDETKKSKLKQDYNLNTFRYGVQARLGWRGINAYGYYALSPLFDEGEGPEQTEAQHLMVGLSIALF
jgi:hypothetical protein